MPLHTPGFISFFLQKTLFRCWALLHGGCGVCKGPDQSDAAVVVGQRLDAGRPVAVALRVEGVDVVGQPVDPDARRLAVSVGAEPGDEVLVPGHARSLACVGKGGWVAAGSSQRVVRGDFKDVDHVAVDDASTLSHLQHVCVPWLGRPRGGGAWDRL